MRLFSRNRAARTAAVIQFEAVHEEVIPSVCRALSEAGITPTVYLNADIEKRRGDIFPHLAPGAFEYHYVPMTSREDWNRLQKTILGRRRDSFVFLNTFQRAGIVRWTAELNRPVLGIVHNPELFLASEECLDFAAREDVGLVALADHAASYLIARRPELMDRVATLVPVHWGREARPSGDRRRIAVPGAVNYGNRSYDFLFEAFGDRGAATDGLEIRIMGGGPDRADLETRVAGAGLQRLITFSALDAETGFVDHRTYFDDLREASFVLPLLPPARQDYRTYKITAALSTAQGLAVPPLLDRWTAMVYRAPALFVPQGELPAALRRAADMPAREHAALREELIAFRDRRLARNAAELSYLAGTVAPG